MTSRTVFITSPKRRAFLTSVLTIALALGGTAISNGQTVIFSDIEDIDAFDAIVSNPSNTIVAKAKMRAGGTNPGEPEVSMGEGNTLTEHDTDFAWALDGNPNAVQLTYDSSIGSLDLTVNSGIGEPAHVGVTPGEWFNAVLLSGAFGFPGSMTLADAEANGQGFGPWHHSQSSGGYGYLGGIQISLPENTETNMGDFLLIGNWTINPLVPIAGDDFRGEIYFMQVPPESLPPSIATPIATTSVYTNGQLFISWQADTNGAWHVQESHSLLDSNGWIDLAGPLTATGGVLDSSTAVTSSPSFYRLIHRSP
jgi:hypothetical protein